MSSHYVYVIVNKKNLKLYFGSHSWEGEGADPNYYGSGKIIKQAVKKYGKENFIIQPIKFYNNVEECRNAEEELLTKYDVANNPYCYNIKNGAIGWTSEDMKGKNNPMYGKHLSEEHRKNISQAHKGENHPMYGKHHTAKTRNKMSQSKKGEKHPMYNKHHTEETRNKISQSKKNVMTPIVAIDKNGKVKIFESQHECSQVLGVNSGNINNCLKGIRKQTKGYTFKYIEELESGIYEGML